VARRTCILTSWQIQVLPVLTTARLRLRPTAEDDFEALWTLWTEPQVRQFLWDDATIERERALDAIREFAALAPSGLGLWTVLTRDEPGALVGCAALAPVSTAAEYYPPSAGAVEPLVALDPRVWHQGYAIEILKAIVDYARTTAHVDRLVAVTDVPNVASDRLVRRAGFVVCAETDGPRYRLRHYRLDG
jgi:RimJ/RimL family protein N-acetyltransferase